MSNKFYAIRQYYPDYEQPEYYSDYNNALAAGEELLKNIYINEPVLCEKEINQWREWNYVVGVIELSTHCFKDVKESEENNNE